MKGKISNPYLKKEEVYFYIASYKNYNKKIDYYYSAIKQSFKYIKI